MSDLASRGKYRILIVAAEYPPMKAIGRMRPVKMCQILPELGWDVAVLTTVGAGNCSEETLIEIPQTTKVFRVPLYRPIECILGKFRKNTGRKQLKITGSKSNGLDEQRGDICFVKKTKLQNLRCFLGKLKGNFDQFAGRHLFIPDDFVFWAIPAAREGLKICKDWHPDIIFTTAPPFSSLILGAYLKRKTNIPWVADYRDLWTGDVLREWLPAWRKRFELRMEKQVLGSADAVISVSGPKTEVLKKRLSKLHPDCFHTMTNGYDEDEFCGIDADKADPAVINFVYAGRLFKNRKGFDVLEAAGQLISEQPELYGSFKFEYYGGIAPEISEEMDKIINKYSIHDSVKCFGDVSYMRSKAVQKGADVLLLIVDSGETSSGVIPGKLFEYISAAKPIMCIASTGATTEIIKDARLGWICEPGDIISIKNALDKIISKGEYQNFMPNKNILSLFERKKIVKKKSEIFKEIIDKK